jgi:hypothetical protein
MRTFPARWVLRLFQKKKRREEPLTEGHKALLVLAAVMAAGFLCALIYAARSKAEQGFLSVASVSLLLAGASTFVGGLLGFLFGIPRTLQQEGANAPVDPNAQSPSGSATSRIEYRVNTNLEQISDWLTKILVGVGLTQIAAIRDVVGSLIGFAAQAFGSQPQNQVFAFALLSYFTVLGFLFGYLWTRLVFTGALRAADQAAIGVLVKSVQKATEKAEITERKLDEFKKQSELDVAALQLAYRQLNPTRDLPAGTQEELNTAISLASPPVKIQVFNQAWQLRSESWRDQKTKPKVELTIPVFRALISSDTQNKYYRNHAELGYALKDKLQPDWAAAEQELTTAIKIRGPWKEHGWVLYEMNRAECRIMLDPDFAQNRPSDPTRKEEIIDDLRAAFRAPDLRTILRRDVFKKWSDLNEVTDKELRSSQ